MSDAEVVAEFMEPRPEDYASGVRGLSVGGWWKSKWSAPNQRFRYWPTDDLDSLDRLRLVEARLTEEQKDWYGLRLIEQVADYKKNDTRIRTWHASAEQKLVALAQVLRKEGE